MNGSPVFRLVAVLALLFGTAASGAEPDGRRIYEEGLLADGRSLQGMVQSDVPLDAKQLVCATCHRRSGLGSIEGGIVVPAVTGNVLFTPRTIARRELYASRTEGPLTRPAYTEASLARALREGVDAAGTPLDKLMPRYTLMDAEVAAIAEHLRSLSPDRVPGVTPREIHFATITSDRLPPGAESSLMALMGAFLDAKNGRTRHEWRRAEHAPWHKDPIYPAYRTWVLHHWRLTGPVDTWRAQLERLYREQPVFAILSGSVGEAWSPIHAFSEAHAIPTLLPHTDRPATGGYYTLYPSEGVRLRAKTLAHDLSTDATGTIVQIHAGSGAGPAGAAALRQLWSGRAPLVDFDLDQNGEALADRIAALRPNAVVLWLDGIPEGALAGNGNRLPVDRLYLVSSQLELPQPSQAPLFDPKEIRSVSPYILPEGRESGFRRLRLWLEAQEIPVTDPRLLADAYLALTTAGEALMHMHTWFSGHYFIEKLEHALNRTTFSGFYPELTSAPGQRFVAKGCYLVALDSEGTPMEQRWVIP